ncbi:hypothetical protein Lal_00043177 [Lupinus albus]|nr:hypothetical protein Lal_00043177 [Lupinus albus]
MANPIHAPRADKKFHLDEEHHPEGSTNLGFWLYLMSDLLIFAALFATYAVDRGCDGNPAGVIDYLWCCDDPCREQCKGCDDLLAWCHRPARPRIPGAGGIRILSSDRGGCWSPAVRLPVVILRPRRHAWPPCHVWGHLACGAYDTGVEVWPHSGEPSTTDVPVNVLALPRPHLDRCLLSGLSYGSCRMTSNSSHNGAHGGHSGHRSGRSSLKSYMTGFILSLILTAIPFWLVMGDVIESKMITIAAIMILGGIQMLVHMTYFLHMNSRSEGGWTMMALIFTIVILVIVLVGSIWVMYHLNTNMMPMSPEMMKNMP